MIKCIMFDAYGTLFSTGNGSIKATEEIFSKYNLNDSSDEIYKKWKKIHRENTHPLNPFKKEANIFIDDLKELFSIYGIDGDAESEVKPMTASLFGRVQYDDASSVNALRDEYTLILASNSDTRPLIDSIINSTLSFDKVYTSESLCAYKPSRRFFEKILDSQDFKRNEILFIGDSLIDDVYGASQLGIKTCLLDRNNTYSKASNIKPNYILNSLYGLSSLLDKINSNLI